VKTTVYLVADAHGVCRMTKRPPDLYRNEVAVRLNVTIPDECFRRPVPVVSLEVTGGQLIEPTAVIDVLDPPA